ASAAETARVVAAEVARKAARDLQPISVFISRKTQHLYIRQAFQRILDTPVTIQDADRPIGTHIFTAVERTGAEIRWSVVSLVADGSEANGTGRESRGAAVTAPSSDLSTAKAALDRVVI